MLTIGLKALTFFRERTVVLRTIVLGQRMQTLGLSILILCERANRSSKGDNSRSEGANSRFKDINFI